MRRGQSAIRLENHMKRFIPTLIFSALAFMLLATACSGLPAPTLTSAESTALVSGLTMLPQGTGVVITTMPQTGVAPLTSTANSTPQAGTAAGTPGAALPAL